MAGDRLSNDSPPRVLVVTLGATALLAYDAAAGGMALRLAPARLLADAAAALDSDGHSVETLLVEIPRRSGAELTMHTVCAVRDAVLDALPSCSSAVLLCGTDTLEEAAFLLHLMLGCALLRWRTTLCVTGAMLPSDQLGCDGTRNLRDALQVASDPGVRAAAAGSVLVVMNSTIHLAQLVRKADSQLPGAFRSHPGPLGQVRGGHPLLYFAPPPPPPAAALPPEPSPSAAAGAATGSGSGAGSSAGGQGTGGGTFFSQPPHPPWLPRPEFERLSAAQLSKRVAIWPLTVDGVAPPEALLRALDGLVLAGSGTGSLPAAVVDRLAGAPVGRHGSRPNAGGADGRHGGGRRGGASRDDRPWAARLPIVVSSRCDWGPNHDDHSYRGSLSKREGTGFVQRQGYEHLNPLQARSLLALRLAAFGRA